VLDQCLLVDLLGYGPNSRPLLSTDVPRSCEKVNKLRTAAVAEFLRLGLEIPTPVLDVVASDSTIRITSDDYMDKRMIQRMLHHICE
jgi:hypothetical protein